MNPIWGHIVGIITLTMMLIFIGIWIWLWRKKHRKVFDRMARLPMEDKMSQDSQETDKNTENNHHE